MYQFWVRTCQYTHAMSVVGNIVLANFLHYLATGIVSTCFWCSLQYLHQVLVESKFLLAKHLTIYFYMFADIIAVYTLNKSCTLF